MQTTEKAIQGRDKVLAGAGAEEEEEKIIYRVEVPANRCTHAPCMCVHAHEYMHVGACVYVCKLCAYVLMYICVCVCVRVCVHTCVCLHHSSPLNSQWAHPHPPSV